MTDVCEQVRTLIIESFDGPAAPSPAPGVTDHLRSCSSCAAFAQIQHDLDERLAASFTPPQVAPGVRPRVWRQIRRDKVERLSEWLPSLMPLVGLGIVLSVYLATGAMPGRGVMPAVVAVMSVWAALAAAGAWMEER